eukprot:gene5901-7349_t
MDNYKPCNLTEFKLNNSRFDFNKVSCKSINDIVKDGYLIENVLTTDECKLILSTLYEKNKVNEPGGYSKKLGKITTKNSEELSSTLLERVKQFIPNTIKINNIKSIDEWKFSTISPRHTFIKYDVGQEFPSHTDGPYKKNEKYQSHYSILFFLNDGGGVDFEGGNLIFLNSKFGVSSEQPVSSITPKTGLVVVFPHISLHKSSTISMGTKFVIRNDLVYSLTNSTPWDMNSIQSLFVFLVLLILSLIQVSYSTEAAEEAVAAQCCSK